MIRLSLKALFSADCEKDRDRISRLINRKHYPKDVYYLLLRPQNTGGLMDIVSGRELRVLPQGEERVAAGIARTKAEAIDLAAEIIRARCPEEPGLKERICLYYKS